ncbi:hypothetical protein ACSSS7_000982 [Eimeria intestinalis]
MDNAATRTATGQQQEQQAQQQQQRQRCRSGTLAAPMGPPVSLAALQRGPLLQQLQPPTSSIMGRLVGIRRGSGRSRRNAASAGMQPRTEASRGGGTNGVLYLLDHLYPEELPAERAAAGAGVSARSLPQTKSQPWMRQVRSLDQASLWNRRSSRWGGSASSLGSAPGAAAAAADAAAAAGGGKALAIKDEGVSAPGGGDAAAAVPSSSRRRRRSAAAARRHALQEKGGVNSWTEAMHADFFLQTFSLEGAAQHDLPADALSVVGSVLPLMQPVLTALSYGGSRAAPPQELHVGLQHGPTRLLLQSYACAPPGSSLFGNSSGSGSLWVSQFCWSLEQRWSASSCSTGSSKHAFVPVGQAVKGPLQLPDRDTQIPAEVHESLELLLMLPAHVQQQVPRLLQQLAACSSALLQQAEAVEAELMLRRMQHVEEQQHPGKRSSAARGWLCAALLMNREELFPHEPWLLQQQQQQRRGAHTLGACGIQLCCCLLPGGNRRGRGCGSSSCCCSFCFLEGRPVGAEETETDTAQDPAAVAAVRGMHTAEASVEGAARAAAGAAGSFVEDRDNSKRLFATPLAGVQGEAAQYSNAAAAPAAAGDGGGAEGGPVGKDDDDMEWELDLALEDALESAAADAAEAPESQAANAAVTAAAAASAAGDHESDDFFWECSQEPPGEAHAATGEPTDRAQREGGGEQEGVGPSVHQQAPPRQTSGLHAAGDLDQEFEFDDADVDDAHAAAAAAAAAVPQQQQQLHASRARSLGGPAGEGGAAGVSLDVGGPGGPGPSGGHAVKGGAAGAADEADGAQAAAADQAFVQEMLWGEVPGSSSFLFAQAFAALAWREADAAAQEEKAAAAAGDASQHIEEDQEQQHGRAAAAAAAAAHAIEEAAAQRKGLLCELENSANAALLRTRQQLQQQQDLSLACADAQVLLHRQQATRFLLLLLVTPKASRVSAAPALLPPACLAALQQQEMLQQQQQQQQQLLLHRYLATGRSTRFLSLLDSGQPLTRSSSSSSSSNALLFQWADVWATQRQQHLLQQKRQRLVRCLFMDLNDACAALLLPAEGAAGEGDELSGAAASASAAAAAAAKGGGAGGGSDVGGVGGGASAAAAAAATSRAQLQKMRRRAKQEVLKIDKQRRIELVKQGKSAYELRALAAAEELSREYKTRTPLQEFLLTAAEYCGGRQRELLQRLNVSFDADFDKRHLHQREHGAATRGGAPLLHVKAALQLYGVSPVAGRRSRVAMLRFHRPDLRSGLANGSGRRRGGSAQAAEKPWVVLCTPTKFCACFFPFLRSCRLRSFAGFSRTCPSMSLAVLRCNGLAVMQRARLHPVLVKPLASIGGLHPFPLPYEQPFEGVALACSPPVRSEVLRRTPEDSPVGSYRTGLRADGLEGTDGGDLGGAAESFHPSHCFYAPKDLTLSDDCPFALFEYTEQQPFILNNPGMSVRVTRYVRPLDAPPLPSGTNSQSSIKADRIRSEEARLQGSLGSFGGLRLVEQTEKPPSIFGADVPLAPGATLGRGKAGAHLKLIRIPDESLLLEAEGGRLSPRGATVLGVCRGGTGDDGLPVVFCPRLLASPKPTATPWPRKPLQRSAPRRLSAHSQTGQGGMEGQLQPKVEVPAPQSKKVVEERKLQSKAWALRFVRETGVNELKRVKDLVRSRFCPPVIEKEVAQLLKQLSPIAPHRLPVLSEAAITSIISPETVCSLESSHAAWYRLKAVGIVSLTSPEGLSSACAFVEAEERKQQQAAAAARRRLRQLQQQQQQRREALGLPSDGAAEAAAAEKQQLRQLVVLLSNSRAGRRYSPLIRFIEELLLSVPWQTTKECREVLQNKGSAQFLLTGFGDPSCGRGEGIALLKRGSRTRSSSSNPLAVQQTARRTAAGGIAGTVDDLRKLGMMELRARLLQYGLSDAVIRTLPRCAAVTQNVEETNLSKYLFPRSNSKRFLCCCYLYQVIELVRSHPWWDQVALVRQYRDGFGADDGGPKGRGGGARLPADEYESRLAEILKRQQAALRTDEPVVTDTEDEMHQSPAQQQQQNPEAAASQQQQQQQGAPGTEDVADALFAGVDESDHEQADEAELEMRELQVLRDRQEARSQRPLTQEEQLRAEATVRAVPCLKWTRKSRQQAGEAFASERVILIYGAENIKAFLGWRDQRLERKRQRQMNAVHSKEALAGKRICRACGRPGHIASNVNCPLYRGPKRLGSLVADPSEKKKRRRGLGNEVDLLLAAETGLEGTGSVCSNNTRVVSPSGRRRRTDNSSAVAGLSSDSSDSEGDDDLEDEAGGGEGADSGDPAYESVGDDEQFSDDAEETGGGGRGARSAVSRSSGRSALLQRKRGRNAGGADIEAGNQQPIDALNVAFARVVNLLLQQQTLKPFVNRVDDRVAPGYSTIVKKPMFLRKILNNCRERQYTSVAAFQTDIDLIVSNCFLFNPPGSPSAWLRERALQLQQLAMQRLADQPQIAAYEAAVMQSSYQQPHQQFGAYGIYDD